MNEFRKFRFLRFVSSHDKLSHVYHWLGSHWFMVVICVLFVVVVLCMINITVMVLTT